MKPGTPVVVTIQRPDEYANGCAAALEGLTGSVERVRDDGQILVAFDTPAPKWWSNQTPCTGFWFPPTDIKERTVAP